MKKLLFACVAFALTATIFLSGLSVYRSLQGDNTAVYTRFYATDSTGNTQFNWLGLLSPVQTENQKIVTDTIRFNHKVVYPYGKNFQCIAPEDSTAEQFVANQIAQVINDSIEKIRFNLSLDYDRTALAVRESAKPTNRQLAKPTVELKLFGTASPEARRHGLERSIMPGHFEPENDTLSRKRLERTATILSQKGFTATSTSWSELQFSDTVSAMLAIQNPAILDSLRWVEANVTIPVERLEVTPATAPVLLPIWLWLLALGLISLWGMRLPKLKRPKPIEWGPWSWGGVWEFLKILFYCIGISTLITLMLMFCDWRYLLLLLALGAVGIFAYFILRNIDAIADAIVNFFLWVIRMIKNFFLLIGKYFIFIWNLLDKFFAWIAKQARYWWRRFLIRWAYLTPCWKRVFVVLAIYAVVMTAVVIYLLF